MTRAIPLLMLLCAGCTGAPRPLIPVEHHLEDARLVVHIDGDLFTEYRFAGDQKYPYFFPVNGPLSHASLTTESSEPYPHHHSLFFACDRVNGGNFWQEGNERGQIVQEDLAILASAPGELTFHTRNRWVRPDAPAPFLDERWITISAPSPTRRFIDFRITLTALVDVEIRKTNHALFAARMVPERAVTAGGSLTNAEGLRDEKATFGQHSAWMDFGSYHEGVYEGLAILNHPSNPWSPPPWFTRDYGFFSPTPMYWLEGGALRLARGESLALAYRVVVHRDPPPEANLAGLHAQWSREAPWAGIER